MSAEPGPVPQRERIAALDVARGCAVLGVLLMNIWSFAGPQAFSDYPLAIADRPGAPVATWLVIHTLFEGSQRTLLSLLFGAGALLVINRFEQPGQPGSARGIYYRRTLGLVLLGLINAWLFMWPADILFAYGLAGMCLYPLRRLRTRWLLAIALAALAVPLVLRGLETSRLTALESAAIAAIGAERRGEALSEPQQAAIRDWDKALKKARPDAADEEIVAGIRTMQSGSLAGIWKRQAASSVILETIVLVRWWFLDALAMMIIGMVLWRTGIVPGGRRSMGAASVGAASAAIPKTIGAEAPPTKLYIALAIAGFAVGLPVAVWQMQSLLATEFHPVQVEFVKMSYDLRRLAMGIGWLSLILLLARMAGAPAIRARLAAVGRMALTNYLAQSIVGGFIFYGFGLGLYGRITGYQLYYVVAAIWALEIAWSGWWLARFQIGPFEWLLRSFMYGRPQSWRGAMRTAAG